MGYSGRGKKTIGVNIEVTLADYIEARAKRLEQTTSWAAGKIIEMWMERGAPALSEADKHMPPLPLPQVVVDKKLKDAVADLGKKTATSEPFHKRR